MNRQSVIEQVRQESVAILDKLVTAALEAAAEDLSRTDSGAAIATRLVASGSRIKERFGRYLGYGFDRLLGNNPRRIEVGEYPEPSLVDERFLESVNAMEGMVNYCRNTFIRLLINLNVRLSELLPESP